MDGPQDYEGIGADLPAPLQFGNPGMAISPSAISGIYFIDQNGDDVFGAGDQVLVGGAVNLLTSSNALIASTTTDAGGNYSFSGLANGDYHIQFVAPSGDQFSTPTNGGGGSNDDSGNTPGIVKATVHNGNVTGINQGVYQAAKIVGDVFQDNNGDGSYDGSEKGVSGVVVELDDKDGNRIASATTGSDGSYEFGALAPGSYEVKVSSGNGGGDNGGEGDGGNGQGARQFSTPSTESVTVHSGDDDKVNFGTYISNSVTGTVFVDSNADGTQQAGESGFSGQTVELLKGSNVAATTTTAADGSYTLSASNSGSYTVKVIAAGDSFSTASSKAVSLTSGGAVTFNAGEYAPASVSGKVFVDSNNDGTQNNGEAGFAGQTVKLLSGSTVVGAATTASDGSYSITGIAPGSYTVQVVGAAGDTFSTVSSETVSLTSGSAITFNAGEFAPSNNNSNDGDGSNGGDNGSNGDDNSDNDNGSSNSGGAPASPSTGTVRSFVFFDGQNTGAYHVGDAGVAGVTVKLLDAQNNVAATTTTDSKGGYQFSSVAVGSYHVQVVAPQGAAFSTVEHASGNPLLDSDVNSQGISDGFSVTANATVTGENAGLLLTGNFAGQTPVELGNGQQYASQTGGKVVVGAGGNNVHTGSPGDSVVVLGGNGNTMELGLSSSSQEDIGISLGQTQGQTQSAANGFLFAGGAQASYLDGGSGNSYLMAGAGANQVYAGSGNNTIIAGGNGSLITTGGASTNVIYQKGDGLQTIDNGLRNVDHLTVFGYTGGVVSTVGGIEELDLSATDRIVFVGPTGFGNGPTGGNSEISFVSSIAGAPTATLSFDANGMPVFTTDILPAGNGSAPVVNALVETAQAQNVALGSGTGALQLFGYNNVVVGGDNAVAVSGDAGHSNITLGNGNNSLVLGGSDETATLGNGFNTVSGSTGNLTLNTTGAANVSAGGYGNHIALGNGDSIVQAGVGNATVSVGVAASQGSITTGGQNNAISTTGGNWNVAAGNGHDSVAVGASTDTVTLAGYFNTVSVSTGHATVSGSIGFDTFAATDFGGLDITGFNLGQGDVLDVTGALTKAGFSGSNLGNYLSVAQSGNDTLVSVAGHLVADVHGINASALTVGHGLTV